jgi:quinol monooxygenase YgiN
MPFSIPQSLACKAERTDKSRLPDGEKDSSAAWQASKSAYKPETRCNMEKFGLYVALQAKPGKEDEVEQFLRNAMPLVNAEPGTISWYAVRQPGSATFGIFDTFQDEAGRKAHLSGKVAEALFAKAPELFSKSPEVHMLEIVAQK